MAFPNLINILFDNFSNALARRLRTSIMPLGCDDAICWMLYPSLLANPKAGFYAPTGGLISNANTVVPLAYAYLQTAEGQTLCTSQAAWDAERADAKWGGQQGACAKYVIDTGAKTIRLPDLRGLVMEQAGYDSLSVGASHGDYMQGFSFGSSGASVADSYTIMRTQVQRSGGTAVGYSSLVVAPPGTATPGTAGTLGGVKFTDGGYGTPRVGNATKPRAYGANVCVYLGTA